MPQRNNFIEQIHRLEGLIAVVCVGLLRLGGGISKGHT